jgi:hypothetical protein
MAPPKLKPLLVAPDRVTAAHVAGELHRAGIEPGATFVGGRGWAGRARKAIEAAGSPVMLLVPASKLRRQQLDLAEQVTRAGGAVLAWSAGGAAGLEGDWLVTRLLEQRGALADERLPVLILATRILSFVGLEPRPATVSIQKRASVVSERLRAAIENCGITSGSARKNSIKLDISTSGELRIAGDHAQSPNLGDPDTAAAALALILGRAEASGAGRVDPGTVEQDVVDLIVQPPARILSETASKRLLAAYGVPGCAERLCGSPTEATRFAARIGGPSVLKLVRPSLVGKDAAGAVVRDVSGGAAVRRTFQSLESLAERLGPPPPLGVLVAEQIDGGARAWIEMVVHEQFGRLLLIGAGDDPTGRARTVLTAPPSPLEAIRAVERAGLAADSTATRSLATAVVRFGKLVDQLGPRITRAEIHPLVAIDGQPVAKALDALVGIAD